MTVKYKIVWIMAVTSSSRGKASWSGTDPPLVAVLFLHQRRGWCPLGEATEDDKIPLIFNLGYLKVVCVKCQHI